MSHSGFEGKPGWEPDIIGDGEMFIIEDEHEDVTTPVDDSVARFERDLEEYLSQADANDIVEHLTDTLAGEELRGDDNVNYYLYYEAVRASVTLNARRERAEELRKKEVARNEDLRADADMARSELSSTSQALASANAETSRARKSAETYQRQLSESEKKLSRRSKRDKVLRVSLAVVSTVFVVSSTVLGVLYAQLRSESQELSEQKAVYENQIRDLKGTLDQEKAGRSQSASDAQSLQQKVEQSEQLVRDKDKDIADLTGAIKERDDEITRLNEQLNIADENVRQAQERINNAPVVTQTVRSVVTETVSPPPATVTVTTTSIGSLF